MKKQIPAIILFVGAGLSLIYSIYALSAAWTNYSSYIEYYGLATVLPTIIECFFQPMVYTFILFGMGALCWGLSSTLKFKPAPKKVKGVEPVFGLDVPAEVKEEKPVEKPAKKPAAKKVEPKAEKAPVKKAAPKKAAAKEETK